MSISSDHSFLCNHQLFHPFTVLRFSIVHDRIIDNELGKLQKSNLEYPLSGGCFMSKIWVNPIKDRLQQLTYHRRIPSVLSAQLMYLFSRLGGNRHENISANLLTFCETGDGNHTVDSALRSKIVKDMLFSRVFYAVSYKEYFLFQFEKLSDAEKRLYIGWHELDSYYTQLNKLGNPGVFENKSLTYLTFKPFYHREIVSITDPSNSSDFFNFFSRHSDGIIKPLDEYGGYGISLISITDNYSPEQAWDAFRSRTPFILEERIIQAPEMAQFYPQSVNTIRYNTFYHDGKLTRLQAVLRLGRGGSVVDNATAGGIYALVDTDSGKILGPARSFKGELFYKHPDTGIQLEGNYVPHWDELNAILEQAVLIVPEQKQVGWDFALSTDGWVMVEGNTTPALQSFDLRHGLKPLVEKTFGAAIHMWK